MKLLILLIFLSNSLLAQSTSQKQIDDLTKRIEELELQQSEFLIKSSDSEKDVQSFLKDKLTLGGFFEAGILTISGPDTRLQSMNDSNILGLNFSAEFSNRIRFVSQIITGLTYPIPNPHADPRATNPDREFGSPFFGALLTQGYLEHTLNDNHRIQAGVGYVPFGYALQQRELVLFVRRGGPQILRTPQLVAPLWTGVHLLGSFSDSKSSWGYNLYTANPIDDANVLGVGGRLWWASQDDRLTTGLSSQVMKYENSTSEILGSDIRFVWDNFIVTTEYIRHMAEENDPWAAYLETGMYVLKDEFLLYLFGDYSANERNKTSSTISDPLRKWEYGGGLNWLPTSFTRIRFGVTYNDYVGIDSKILGQNRNYLSFDTSVGVAF